MTDLIYTYIAIFLFGVFDYFGYNFARLNTSWLHGHHMLNPYRFIQTAVQILIGVALIFVTGNWWTVFFYWLLWWSWNADLIYYLLYDTLKIYGSGAFKREVLGNRVRWAYWSGIFFVRGDLFAFLRGHTPVQQGAIILFQATIGNLLTIIFLT